MGDGDGPASATIMIQENQQLIRPGGRTKTTSPGIVVAYAMSTNVGGKRPERTSGSQHAVSQDDAPDGQRSGMCFHLGSDGDKVQAGGDT